MRKLINENCTYLNQINSWSVITTGGQFSHGLLVCPFQLNNLCAILTHTHNEKSSNKSSFHDICEKISFDKQKLNANPYTVLPLKWKRQCMATKNQSTSFLISCSPKIWPHFQCSKQKWWNWKVENIFFWYTRTSTLVKSTWIEKRAEKFKVKHTVYFLSKKKVGPSSLTHQSAQCWLMVFGHAITLIIIKTREDRTE